MALEQLSQAPNPVDGNTNAVQDSVEGRPASVDGGRAPRLPRWTRQEILVLIQGKRVAENRVRRGRTAGMAFGSGQVEPKWASVSSYCKRHGVNRGPVQCRKRWSNLAGDYKKIKEWESQINEESESFWAMRNDLRRERKLPGFFDKEVYDILDGGPSVSAVAPVLALALTPAVPEPATVTDTAEEVDADTEAVLDSGRSAAAEDGPFSDFDQDDAGRSSEKDTAAKDAPSMKTTAIPAVPISELQYQPNLQGRQGEGRANEKQPEPNPEIGSTSQDGRKRRRFETDGDAETENLNLQYQLIDILQRNGKMLTAQLEAHNTNLQLDREQRKNHADSLVAVLNKLADAVGRIADKL